MNMNVEGEYKVSPEEIEEHREKRLAAMPENRGFLLDQPFSHWQKFINEDGALDEAALLAGGYNGEGQVEWIAAELAALGWLGGDSKDTAPLEDPAL